MAISEENKEIGIIIRIYLLIACRHRATLPSLAGQSSICIPPRRTPPIATPARPIHLQERPWRVPVRRGRIPNLKALPLRFGSIFTNGETMGTAAYTLPTAVVADRE